MLDNDQFSVGYHLVVVEFFARDGALSCINIMAAVPENEWK